jgi:mannose-6-phosphate isomerase-like protein (cupin superfamily)
VLKWYFIFKKAPEFPITKHMLGDLELSLGQALYKQERRKIMNLIELNSQSVIETPHKVDIKRLFDTKDVQVIHIILQPGENLKRHITPVNVFFYVLEGKGMVEIGEENKVVGKDTLVESPANVTHCWYNQGSEPLRFLVVKTPRPHKKSTIL